MSALGITPELAAQLRLLLASATSASVPGGVLTWLGPDDLPDGTTRISELDQATWEAVYMRLQEGSLASDIVPPLAQVLAATTAFRPDACLPIAVARFRYGRPQAELLAHVRRAAAEGRPLRHPPSTLAGHVDAREAFFATALLHDQWGSATPTYRGRRVPFLLREDLILSNSPDRRPDRVELDPGDGGGFRSLALGTPLIAEYPGDALAHVTLRCHYGEAVRTARFTLALGDRPAAPVPDEQWPLRGDCGNTGTAHVYRALGAQGSGFGEESSPLGAVEEARRPMIMVEGFPGAIRRTTSTTSSASRGPPKRCAAMAMTSCSWSSIREPT